MRGLELINYNKKILINKIIVNGEYIFDDGPLIYSMKYMLGSESVVIKLDKITHEIIGIALYTLGNKISIPIDMVNACYINKIKYNVRRRYYQEISNDIQIIVRIERLYTLISNDFYDIMRVV